jgi:hypothetical protein
MEPNPVEPPATAQGNAGEKGCAAEASNPPVRPARTWFPPPAVGTEDLAEQALVLAYQRFERYCDGLEPQLALSMQTMASQLSRRVPSLESLFLGSRGTPAFVMIAWIAESLLGSQPDPGLLGRVGEAMLSAYLAVRIQDDRIDGDALDPTWSYLEHALLGHSVRLQAGISGRAVEFLVEWERQARRFSEAATRDARMRFDPHETWSDPAALALQGEKFLPMAGPLSALLWHAEREHAVPALVEVVLHLGRGLQAANDFFNAEADLQDGRGSAWLTTLGVKPSRDGVTEYHGALRRAFADRQVEQYLHRIKYHYLSATLPLRFLGSARFAHHIQDRIRALDEACLTLVGRSLGVAAAVESHRAG